MVRLLGMLGFGVIVFGAAAGGTWYWKTHLSGSHGDATADAGHGKKQGEESDYDSESGHDEEFSDEAAASSRHGASSSSSSHGHGAGRAATTSEPPAGMTGLPVAVRPRPMSIEELLRFGMGLNEREEALKQRENGMQRQELQLKLALADLKGEQEEIEGLRTQVQQQLGAADGYLRKIQKARDDLVHDRQQDETRLKKIEATQIRIEDSQKDNIKQLSTWIQSMEPAKSADVIREMTNGGKMDTAVMILSQLEDRDVAKVLSELNDSQLVTQLISKRLDLKQEKRTASRK